jgi:hypothetical protein
VKDNVKEYMTNTIKEQEKLETTYIDKNVVPMSRSI